MRTESQNISDLPQPDAQSMNMSEQLTAVIREEIEACGGCITFARFMELALYAPGLGYYVAGLRKFGESGDFVTAPEISPMFSYCLARQCAQVLEALGGGSILEFGAGSGIMASDILAELERCNQLPQKYRVLEVSGELRERQRETIQQRVPHLLDRVEWLDQLPADRFQGVVLANEVLDAMPVHRFRKELQGLSEVCVSWDVDRFVWTYTPPTQELASWELPGDVPALPAGYESEVNLSLSPWIASLSETLSAGVMLLIDYGFPSHEYYHPQRGTGTLMCHYRHRAHPDPLILTGLQDITAHVDFTAVAEAAHKAGMDVAGFTSQAYFLLSLGLTEMVADTDAAVTRQQIETARQIKLLTLPSEMGELFKVIALCKNTELPLAGFSMHDQRGRL
jgi:SAM-dependent MidA family methyltransferase